MLLLLELTIGTCSRRVGVTLYEQHAFRSNQANAFYI